MHLSTVPSRNRSARGSEAQTWTAEYLAAHGFPGALPVGAGRPGRDVTGTPGLAVEVKAREDWDTRLNVWLAQAVKRAGDDLPLLVSRPSGYGREKLAIWPVTFRLVDAVTLLRDAGYGDPGGPDDT
jgi:hypothetical protein